MKLDEVLKLRKAKKYLKRTGSPGNYKYIYREKRGGYKGISEEVWNKLGEKRVREIRKHLQTIGTKVNDTEVLRIDKEWKELEGIFEAGKKNDEEKYHLSGLTASKKKKRKPSPITLKEMQREVRRKKPPQKTLAQMQEERGKKKKSISSKEYMKEHAVGIRKEADELKRMSKKDFRKRLEAKYEGEAGRKQLIKDLVNKLKREAPKHSFSEIEEGAFSTKDMLDMFIGD